MLFGSNLLKVIKKRTSHSSHLMNKYEVCLGSISQSGMREFNLKRRRRGGGGGGGGGERERRKKG